MPNPKQILATPMQEGNQASAETIGDYLVKLLEQLWDVGAEFTGKRPFGHSNWDSDLEIALINAGHIQGAVDGDGHLERSDSMEANRLIVSAIGALRTSWVAD